MCVLSIIWRVRGGGEWGKLAKVGAMVLPSTIPKPKNQKQARSKFSPSMVVAYTSIACMPILALEEWRMSSVFDALRSNCARFLKLVYWAEASLLNCTSGGQVWSWTNEYSQKTRSCYSTCNPPDPHLPLSFLCGVEEFYRVTDKAISQNVQLLGCVCKTRKNWDICCCSTKFVAPTKKTWKGEKDTTLQHWINSVKNLASARTSRPLKSERGDHHLCVLGTWTSCCWTSVTLRIHEGGK